VYYYFVDMFRLIIIAILRENVGTKKYLMLITSSSIVHCKRYVMK